MLSIANEVDPLIFRCVCFVCDTNMYFSNIGDLELKLQKVEATVVKEFKDSNEYSDELCGYYVEGFDLLRKWMAKHHPDLDLFGLVMGEVKKELLTDHPSEAIVDNVMEETTDVAEVMEEAAITTPIDLVPNKQ